MSEFFLQFRTKCDKKKLTGLSAPRRMIFQLLECRTLDFSPNEQSCSNRVFQDVDKKFQLQLKTQDLGRISWEAGIINHPGYKKPKKNDFTLPLCVWCYIWRSVILCRCFPLMEIGCRRSVSVAMTSDEGAG